MNRIHDVPVTDKIFPGKSWSKFIRSACMVSSAQERESGTGILYDFMSEPPGGAAHERAHDVLGRKAARGAADTAGCYSAENRTDTNLSKSK